MLFNAWNFSRSWLSVALAASTDDGRPTLYRTTLVEVFHERGVRLVATDGYLLLKAWVPSVDDESMAEPLTDETPDDVMVCTDRDHRVLGLMKYAQTLSRKDGEDTTIMLSMETVDAQVFGQLAGLGQSFVSFRLTEAYDEQIVTPIFEGKFPEWRSLWVGHKEQPTSFVGFGADGVLRLGKLSALWGRAAIEFHLGGMNGAARIQIKAADVNVSGLAMPTYSGRTVPPSEEGISHEFGDALDDFIAQVLATEVAADKDTAVVVEAAQQAQVDQVARFAAAAGVVQLSDVVGLLEVTEDRATEILDQLREAGKIIVNDAGGFEWVGGETDADGFYDPNPGGDEPL